MLLAADVCSRAAFAHLGQFLQSHRAGFSQLG